MAEQLYEQYARLLGPHVVLSMRALAGVLRSAVGDLSSQVMRHFRSLLSPRCPTAITSGPLSSSQQLTLAQEAARDSTQRQPVIKTVDSDEGSNEHQPAGMMMDDENFADESQDEPTIAGVNYEEEFEAHFIDYSHNQGFVPVVSLDEESENIAQSDGNVETVDSDEGSNEHQPAGMMMDDENFADESQDEPTITAVNYEEYEARIMDNSHNQDSVLDGSLNDESVNVSSGDTVYSHMIDSNEADNENTLVQEVLDEQENSTETINEQDQAGPSIVSNPLSTVTRRQTRASASKKVNYSESIENSANDQQQVALIGTGKRKRSNGRRSGKSTAHKRTRVVPAPTVAQVDDDDNEHTPGQEVRDNEAVHLSVTLLHLRCPETCCRMKFLNMVQLNEHLLAKHRIEKFRCLLKGCTTVSFATQSELNGHRKSAHRRLKNWPCAQCETICKSYNKLALHFADYHQQGEFGCSAERCTFTDNTRKRVSNHQTTKHRQRKYRCTFAGCTLSFSRSSHLADHRLLHTKEKHFTCGQCSKAFTQKTHLTRHVRVHSGLKPYHCTWPQCDHSSSDGSNVRRHVRQVHFGLPSSKKEQAERRILDDRDAGEFVERRTGD